MPSPATKRDQRGIKRRASGSAEDEDGFVKTEEEHCPSTSLSPTPRKAPWNTASVSVKLEEDAAASGSSSSSTDCKDSKTFWQSIAGSPSKSHSTFKTETPFFDVKKEAGWMGPLPECPRKKLRRMGDDNGSSSQDEDAPIPFLFKQSASQESLDPTFPTTGALFEELPDDAVDLGAALQKEFEVPSKQDQPLSDDEESDKSNRAAIYAALGPDLTTATSSSSSSSTAVTARSSIENSPDRPNIHHKLFGLQERIPPPPPPIFQTESDLRPSLEVDDIDGENDEDGENSAPNEEADTVNDDDESGEEDSQAEEDEYEESEPDRSMFYQLAPPLDDECIGILDDIMRNIEVPCEPEIIPRRLRYGFEEPGPSRALNGKGKATFEKKKTLWPRARIIEMGPLDVPVSFHGEDYALQRQLDSLLAHGSGV
ncbi:hypothetical protein HDU97_002432 [Phlyctochytrium planicorne]|nr:hypothetical protein HDU97_002432 [Phlyctochytrium planicorne]